MTWPLLLMAVILVLGLRRGIDDRRAQLIAMVAAAALLGYAYLGLGKVL